MFERVVDRRALEQYLHAHIPLSGAMGVAVDEASGERVALSAPLAPNINHRETVFGGSTSAVAILAAWALLHVRLQQQGLGGRIVIQRNTMHYAWPIVGRFTATSAIRDPGAWQKFLETLTRKDRARISVAVALHCGGDPVGELTGDFVALGGRSP
jgi:thioesterase domain-containing protein